MVHPRKHGDHKREASSERQQPHPEARVSPGRRDACIWSLGRAAASAQEAGGWGQGGFGWSPQQSSSLGVGVQLDGSGWRRESK